MKNIILGVVLCLFLATFCFSMGFSLKLTGGAAYITSGDYNDGIDGMNSLYAADYSSVSGTFSKLQFGMNFGAEFILDINQNWGIGLGVGYMQFSHDTETVKGNYTFIGMPLVDTYTLKPSVTSIPITLNVHYFLPMGPVKLNLFAGVGYYVSKMKVDFGYDTVSVGLPLTQLNSFSSNSMSGQFGFQGGLGLEFPLGGNFSFVVGITGRSVSLTDIKGDYTTTGLFLGVPYSASGSDQYFSFVERGNSYESQFKYLVWMTDTTTSLIPPTHAKFDLTGVSAQAGFKVGF